MDFYLCAAFAEGNENRSTLLLLMYLTTETSETATIQIPFDSCQAPLVAFPQFPHLQSRHDTSLLHG